MKLSKKILFSLTVCFISGTSISQELLKDSENEFRIISWKVERGLSSGKVTSLLKDKQGFLWIGTVAGLNRFDGDNFRIYFHDKNNPNSILDDYVTNLIEDSLHNIWLGGTRGLTRYDLQEDTFKNFPSKTTADNPQTFNIPFWATKEEVFCIEPSTGFTAYNIRSFSKKILTNWLPDKIINDHTRLTHSIFDPYTNSIWVVDDDLVQFSLSSHKEYRYKINGRATCQVFDEKRKGIWIGGHAGLTFFSLMDESLHPCIKLNDEIFNKSFDEISSINKDLNGNLWMGINYIGKQVSLVHYNPSAESVDIIRYDPEKQNSISIPEVYGIIHCDREGITWAARYDDSGFDQVISLPAVATNYLPGSEKMGAPENNIICLARAKNNRLWFGMPLGIMEFDHKTGQVKVILDDHLQNIRVNSLAIDTVLQKTWASVWGGLIEIDNITNRQNSITFEDKEGNIIHESSPPVIVAQNNDECFIRLFNHGLFTLKKGSLVATQVIETGHKLIGNVAQAGNRLFFFRVIGEPANLTYLYENGKWSLSKSPFDSIGWSSIYYDENDKTFWIGGRSRVYHYNKEYQLLKEYTEKDGITGIDVLAIEEDERKYIWIVTNTHISRLDQQTGKFVTLTTMDGLAKHPYPWRPPIVKDSEGNIFIGSAYGIDKIQPANLSSYPPSFVYFKSFEINYKPYRNATGINNTTRLDLKYFQNSLSVETGVVDYYSHSSNNIRYKLEGLENEWQYAPVNYMIRYGKLSPRNYRLVIQASNGNNKWEGGEKNIIIKIRPALWNRWWFRFLAVVIILSLFYLILRSRWQQRFRIQEERIEKDRIVAEMRQKSIELEMQALRAQMNPHFIFNSLNSINRFILQNNKAQASEYLTKFSKLVRMILQNSQASLITLESELESLELYLNLESLRFNYHFDYKISVPKELDISALQVPPLILQPYVENAIWHGLMHKEEKGHLDIEVSEEDNHLYFRITDNGIGREKAAELASKSATKHKSMGLRITAHRIAILQNSQTLTSPVTVNDLVNADGSAAGTEVIIRMPVIYD